MKSPKQDLSKNPQPVLVGQACAHCGETCTTSGLIHHEQPYCCQGCATISDLLSAGTAIIVPKKEKWAYLESTEIQDLLLLFKDEDMARVKFELPGVHCSSCIQILEKLPQIHQGILSARLLFSAKEISIAYHPGKMDLREVVELLDHVGYPPKISLDSSTEKKSTKSNKLIIQIGVAGFVFGNVMLMSFPSYLGLEDTLFEKLFGYLSLALCIPLLYISASDYLRSAYAALIHRSLNIDVSIAIGMMTLFLKSAYDIFTQTSPGYLDSLAGFTLFLLIGKWIQQKTYTQLSFERKYEDYFPLHATIKVDQQHQYVPLSKVQPGDFLWVRHGELIPCDGLNVSKMAKIDYSFVTGESRAVQVDSGDKLYAGGKNEGPPLEILVSDRINQSYLTSLWEEDVFHHHKNVDHEGFINQAGKYFTSVILAIALITLVYWYFVDPGMAIATFTSVLIIACPCVLALSTPFTYGSMRSLLAGQNIFFRNTQALEMLRHSDDVIFDKTGTLTDVVENEVKFVGELSKEDVLLVTSLSALSGHPLSRSIAAHYHWPEKLEVSDFQEIPGQGIQGYIGDSLIQLGSGTLISSAPMTTHKKGSIVHYAKNGQYHGYFVITHPVKKGMIKMLTQLKNTRSLHLLSGDNNQQAHIFKQKQLIQEDQLQFNQSPFDKLSYIKNLQSGGHRTLMIGDGLNDAGAFRQSDLSIVVTQDLNNFTPSTDVIMKSSKLKTLPQLLSISHQLKYVIWAMYGFAFLYNGIGLYFAVQGALTPVVAAILMPISSVSIVLFGTLCTYWIFTRHFKS